MAISLDATYSVGRALSGVGVYSREILFGLARAHPDERFVFAYRPHRFLRSWSGSLPHNCRRTLLLDAFPSRTRLFHGLNQRLPHKPGRRTVTTFHDLFVLTAEYSSPDFRERFAQQARDAAARSDLLIAVSSFTAGQVRDLLGVEASRLRVVHHGVRPAAVLSSREKLALHVGAIQIRKNVERLVEAFERLPQDWTLVLAGSPGYGYERVLASIERSPARERIQMPGYVADVGELYARAGLFVFASLDEGFGMPVLEAMAHGVPVIASNRAALPEVCGDAARMVDAGDTEALAAAMQEVIATPGEWIRAGIKRASQFTWDAAVQKTWEVYRELLD